MSLSHSRHFLGNQGLYLGSRVWTQARHGAVGSALLEGSPSGILKLGALIFVLSWKQKGLSFLLGKLWKTDRFRMRNCFPVCHSRPLPAGGFIATSDWTWRRRNASWPGAKALRGWLRRKDSAGCGLKLPWKVEPRGFCWFFPLWGGLNHWKLGKKSV